MGCILEGDVKLDKIIEFKCVPERLVYNSKELDKMKKKNITLVFVVRNGKQSTLGYQPDIWKVWK